MMDVDLGVTLHHGEALATLRTMPDSSVDSIVTDPPAGIEFMGKDWDSFKGDKRQPGDPTFHKSGAGPFDRAKVRYGYSSNKLHSRVLFVDFLAEIMAECLRVAKPGAYALVWAIPRTSHWTGTAIEDAGWVIQDRISHLFGQGFPKHKSKLKPACEDWWLAWKSDRYATPLPGLDGCRIETNGESLRGGGNSGCTSNNPGWDRPWMHDPEKQATHAEKRNENAAKAEELGRWPANVTLDEEAAAMLDEQSGQLTSGKPMGIKAGGKLNCYSEFAGGIPVTGFGDSGGASRFFYVAKASRSERNAGCEDMEKQMLRWSSGDQSPGTFQSEGTDKAAHNHHPTVKPVDLMRWLCRLITPPGGIVLDAFMGSGTTGLAATEEKFRFIGIEREAAYYEIAKRRIIAPAGPLFQ